MKAYDVLREYQTQIDEDGTLVGVSRQALDEVLAEFATLKQELQALREQNPNAWQLIDNTNYLPQYTIYPNKPPSNFSRPLYASPMPAPEGWKLVPIEPTDEMINAYIDSPDMTNWKDDFIIGYKAMLNASQKEPS